MDQHGRARRHLTGMVVVFAVLTLAALGFAAADAIQQTRRDATELVHHLRRAAGRLESDKTALADRTTLERARADVQEADALVDRIDQRVRVVREAMPLASHVPVVGRAAREVVEINDLTRDTVQLLGSTLDATLRIKGITGAGDAGTGESVPALMQRIGEHREELQALADRADALRARVDRVAMRESSIPIGETRKDLATLSTRLIEVADGLRVLSALPTAVGLDEPKTYLILSQNEKEIRPTGGFIGSVGLVTFRHGRIVESRYFDSYAFDSPPDLRIAPPAELARQMPMNYWHLRDANWSPDFPTTAQIIREFYHLYPRAPVDGIIAVDQIALQRLIKAVGPIREPTTGDLITAENIMERIEYHVHGGGRTKSLARRKDFLTHLSRAVIAETMTLPAPKFDDVATALRSAADEGHIQIVSSDAVLDGLAAKAGWRGAVLASDGDFVYPVSTDIGMNKKAIQGAVEQAIEYSVTEDAGGTYARARISFHNRANAPPGEVATYLDLFRLYAPGGAKLVGTAGLADVAVHTDCDYTVFQGLVTVPAGATTRVDLEYRLPDTIRLGRDYSLVIQKQSGRQLVPVTLQIGASQHELVMKGSVRLHSAVGELTRDTARPTLAASDCRKPSITPVKLAAPAKLLIPSLGVAAPIAPLAIDKEGVMLAPEDPDIVGWYPTVSARPGQPGNVVLSGHLDWQAAPAVFYQLRDLTAGDTIEVVDERGHHAIYEVDLNEAYDAQRAPLQNILWPGAGAYVTLITCDGRFDQTVREYSQRRVVRARLVETTEGTVSQALLPTGSGP